LVGRALPEEEVCEGRRSEGEEVMGVWLDLDRTRWRGSEGVLRAGRGTRRVLALKALSILGMAAKRFMRPSPREGVENAERSGRR
jgi:hypothetical protein